MRTDREIIGLKGKTPKILIVDDSIDSRRVFRDMLSPLGFEVSEASNGNEGLKLAERIDPDAVITDLFMPVMDGFEFITRFRQIPSLRDKIIITSSASVYDEFSRKSLDAGTDAFLPKPVQKNSPAATRSASRCERARRIRSIFSSALPIADSP